MDKLSAKQSYEYTGIHGRTSELEDIIATDAEYSYLYARFIMHNRFLKGEQAISTNATYSYAYALQILDGRFPKGEQTILHGGDVANIVNYATDIMHRRWLKAEPIIRQSRFWNSYKRYFNNG